jgi:hypothetical protein
VSDPVDPLTLAYLAGFLDADGYIGLHRKRGAKRTYYSPRVGMSGARREPLDVAVQAFGGRVNFYPARTPERQGVYVWERSGQAAVRVIQALQPFLRAKADHAYLIASW